MRISKALQAKPMGAWLLPLEARMAWHVDRARACRGHLEDVSRNETLFVDGIEPHADNVRVRGNGAPHDSLARVQTAGELREAFESMTHGDPALLPAKVRALTGSERDQNARALANWRATVERMASHHERAAEQHATLAELRAPLLTERVALKFT